MNFGLPGQVCIIFDNLEKRIIMKFRLFLFLLILSGSVSAQEYWDRKDFEIGNRGIETTWKDFAFNWQMDSDFNLPDGTFLNVDQNKKQQIDMLAVMEDINSKKNQRTVDLGSPLPGRERKEKRIFEITGNADPRQRDTYINPYVAPILDPYNRSIYRLRSGSPLYRLSY